VAAEDLPLDEPDREPAFGAALSVSVEVVASLVEAAPEVLADESAPGTSVVDASPAPAGATIATAAPEDEPDTGVLSFFNEATTGASRMPARARRPRRVRKGSRGPRAAARLGPKGTSSPSNQGEAPPEAGPLVRCERVAEELLWVRRPGC
jgi:hypothetical protein